VQRGGRRKRGCARRGTRDGWGGQLTELGRGFYRGSRDIEIEKEEWRVRRRVGRKDSHGETVQEGSLEAQDKGECKSS